MLARLSTQRTRPRGMFLYPPITRLEDQEHEGTAERMNDAFKDVFAPMCRVAKERPQSWKLKQRKEFAKLARKLHEST
jgi:hypothetical protein